MEIPNPIPIPQRNLWLHSCSVVTFNKMESNVTRYQPSLKEGYLFCTIIFRLKDFILCANCYLPCETLTVAIRTGIRFFKACSTNLSEFIPPPIKMQINGTPININYLIRLTIIIEGYKAEENYCLLRVRRISTKLYTLTLLKNIKNNVIQ